MAVLLDGPAWARRGTVGDRDGLPVEVLGGLLRWPVVERVWLPEWLTDPAAVLDRLVAAVESAPSPADLAAADHAAAAARAAAPAPLSAPRSPTWPCPAPLRRPLLPPRSRATAGWRPCAPSSPRRSPRRCPRPAPRPAAAPAAAGLEGETPFVPWAPRTAGDKALLDTLPAAPAARTVRRVLTTGIKAEGPVHVDRLVRLAAGAFGLGRVTESRRAALLAVLPPTALDGDWLWPATVDRESWTGFRRQAASADRPLEHVAPEEIGNAMVALCRAGMGMEREELLTQTALVFGYRRRTPTLTPLLEAALERVLASGRVTAQPDGLLTA